jgi:hypothetical protein
MPRGGRRSGAPGKQYQNRQDMQLGPRKLPVQTAPGQTYGEAGQQAASQQAVPMATAPLTQGAPSVDPQQAAKEFTPPAVVGMGDPTMNPTEHIMAAPQAPAGPPPPVLRGVALLNVLGDAASPEVKALRNVLSAAQGNEAAP